MVCATPWTPVTAEPSLPPRHTMGFTWANPNPKFRSPRMARNVVASSHHLASQAGLRMVLKGGNAIDAAIATAAALTIVEPISSRR